MAISAATQNEQQNDHTTSAVIADVLFGGLTLSSTFGVAGQVYDVADTASELYTDRTLAHENRTNGLYELGVKNALGGAFAASADPTGPKHISAKNDNMTYTKRAEMEFSRKKYAPRFAA